MDCSGGPRFISTNAITYKDNFIKKMNFALPPPPPTLANTTFP